MFLLFQMDGAKSAATASATCLTADVDRVGLLSALGALQQKPRAQVLGAFLADMLPRLPQLSRRQLCDSLQALARLKLSKVDTQVQMMGPAAINLHIYLHIN